MNVVVKKFEEGETRDSSVAIDHLPDECSICHKSGSIKYLSGSLNTMANSGKMLELLVQCPRVSCKAYTIAYYAANQYHSNYHYVTSKPKVPVPVSFNKKIKEVSPEFVAIYGQAKQAEDQNLDKIAGVGYRKAIEFLVKDYLIQLNPEKEEAIKKKALGACIKDDVSDVNVKSVAKRAVWLGNDETHYVRKWNEQDITDLKKLIQLVTYWIESEILTRELVEDTMPDAAPNDTV